MNDCIHPLIGLSVVSITYDRHVVSGKYENEIKLFITYHCPVCGENVEVEHEYKQ